MLEGASYHVELLFQVAHVRGLELRHRGDEVAKELFAHRFAQLPLARRVVLLRRRLQRCHARIERLSQKLNQENPMKIVMTFACMYFMKSRHT